MIERAKRLFHGEEKYNCCQAVLAAYDSEHDKIEDAKSFGGGRAPDGLCGAFFGAKIILGDQSFDNIKEEFRTAAGGLNCQEIRPAGEFSCKECVALAAEKVQKHFLEN